jgi:dolichyl-phosphate beta-glucosyltransferase
MTYVSFIIPAYKSASTLENNLPYLLDFIKEKNWNAEVIVVDDGSQDNGATHDVANRLGVFYYNYTRNKGKGYAVRYGMQRANGKYRIFTDVDIPFEKEGMAQFLHYLDFKEFDVVVGDRTLPQSSYFTEISTIRKFGSNIFSFIVGRFVAGGHFDTQCGMKGFSAKAAEDLFSVGKLNGFAFDVELLYISLKRNYDIKRLPVVLRCQEGSSVNVLKHGTKMLVDLFQIKWNHLTGKYSKSK